MAKSHSTVPQTVNMEQFAGWCWLGGSQILISGRDWTECTLGFLTEAELLILVVPPAFLPQPRDVSQHVSGGATPACSPQMEVGGNAKAQGCCQFPK